MGYFRKVSLAIGTAAILITSITPAMAAVSLERGRSVLTTAGEYDGWGRRHRYRHRDRVDGGRYPCRHRHSGRHRDCCRCCEQEQQSRSRDADRYPAERYPQNEPSNPRKAMADRGNDVGSAVEACSSAVERDGARVDEIRSVTREGEGWRVEGDVSGGRDDNFTCGATNGEVDFVQFGDRDI